jgi:hypothetical protein
MPDEIQYPLDNGFNLTHVVLMMSLTGREIIILAHWCIFVDCLVADSFRRISSIAPICSFVILRVSNGHLGKVEKKILILSDDSQSMRHSR